MWKHSWYLKKTKTKKTSTGMEWHSYTFHPFGSGSQNIFSDSFRTHLTSSWPWWPCHSQCPTPPHALSLGLLYEKWELSVPFCLQYAETLCAWWSLGQLKWREGFDNLELLDSALWKLELPWISCLWNPINFFVFKLGWGTFL